MAANLTQPTGEEVEAFLAAVPAGRRPQDARRIVELMAEVTGEPAAMWGGAMVGFGSRHYRYDSGREGDTFIVGLSPRAAALTLYGIFGRLGPDDPRWERLGPHSTGKGCLYLKSLEGVDLAILEDVVRDAWTRNPAPEETG